MSAIRTILGLVASRRVTPLILAGFALLYVGLAFSTNEALVGLMGLVKGSTLLRLLLALVPLNIVARLAVETRDYLQRRRVMGGASLAEGGLFYEEITVEGGTLGEEAEQWLRLAGYRTARTGGRVAARRGVSLFPARLLFLLGAAALFTGIILSLSGRETVRDALIEGEPFPPFVAAGGAVGQIVLREQSNGVIFARNLTIGATRDDGSATAFGLYPPGRAGGWFVYPRFLGVAPFVRFSAPDFSGIDTFAILMIYPPGREDALEIPGSPYRLHFSLAETPGTDTYANGKFIFMVRVEKGGAAVADLTVPAGSAAHRDGFIVAVPEVKRMVATDFIRDRGVTLIWLSFVCFTAALLWSLPVRILAPRREILAVAGNDDVRTYSRAEGRGRTHAGVYHGFLDLLEEERRGSAINEA